MIIPDFVFFLTEFCTPLVRSTFHDKREEGKTEERSVLRGMACSVHRADR